MGKRLTTEEFIRRARLIHRDKYDYSKVVYINNRTKVIIKHNECDYEFPQIPDSHLQGNGCPKCNGGIKSNKEEFERKANIVHNNEYDYSNFIYINANTKGDIICTTHGLFQQTPGSHLSGKGCYQCYNERRKYTIEDYIRISNEKHNFKYTYERAVYNGSNEVTINTCGVHGDFEQIAATHMVGKGCPKCNYSKLEKIIEDYLIEKKISYIPQKDFKWLINDDTKYKLFLDFYLSEYNVAIECQGRQHFEPVDFGGKGKEWAIDFHEYVKKLDVIKYQLCKENDVRLFYFSDYVSYDYISHIYNDLENLFSNILVNE